MHGWGRAVSALVWLAVLLALLAWAAVAMYLTRHDAGPSVPYVSTLT